MSVLILVFLLASVSASQITEADETYLARAGDIHISENEFLQRFEFLPALYRHRKPQLERAKLELLYAMVAEKLLAQAALEQEVDQSPVFLDAFNRVRKLIVRDQLYREEVAGRVTLTEEEITTGIERAHNLLLVEYIFFDDGDEAVFIREQLESGEDFSRLFFDASVDIFRDTVTVAWGEADPVIEEAVYRLSVGEISDVIAAGPGYYIMHLAAVGPNEFFVSMQPHVLRERVESTIRLRKEEARMDEFVRDFMRNKEGYARSGPFRLLVDAIRDVLGTAVDEETIWLTPERYQEVRGMYAPHLGDTIAVAGETSFSLGDILERIYRKGFGIEAGNLHLIPVRVNTEIQAIVHQELLAQEGLRRGLDSRPSVWNQLEMWYYHYLAEMVKAYVRGSVDIETEDIEAFLESDYNAPSVRIKELRTGTIDDMKDALYDLQNGISFDEVIDRYHVDFMLRQRGGVGDYFPVHERFPVGDIAWSMEIGERYGPVREGNGFVYFELLDKTYAATPDALTPERRRTLEEELREAKARRALDEYIFTLAEQKGVALYVERLREIEVSASPMMTFRMLGFGGRMFAVPFVERLIDWVNIESDEILILP
jgi:hypothetical protein